MLLWVKTMFDCSSFISSLAAALVAAFICFVCATAYRKNKTRNETLDVGIDIGMETGYVIIPGSQESMPYFDQSYKPVLSISQHNNSEYVFSYNYNLEKVDFTPIDFKQCKFDLGYDRGDGDEPTLLYSELKDSRFSKPYVIDSFEYFNNDKIVRKPTVTSLKARPFEMTNDEIVLQLNDSGLYKIKVTTQNRHPNRRKTICFIEVIFFNNNRYDYIEQINNIDDVKHLFNDNPRG